MTDEDWISAPRRETLRGDERFLGMEADVRDFWRFALGDLRMNNARGYLAEFIVGNALGLENIRRTEWDAYDILWGDITIEVKSSAYLQVWDQRRTSSIQFAGLRGTRWHPRHDYDPAGQRYNAMVYVFCVQTATEHSLYDPLDVRQWSFYVVPRSRISALGQKSVGLARVQTLSGGPAAWSELKGAVTNASIGEALKDDAASWWEDEHFL